MICSFNWGCWSATSINRSLGSSEVFCLDGQKWRIFKIRWNHQIMTSVKRGFSSNLQWNFEFCSCVCNVHTVWWYCLVKGSIFRFFFKLISKRITTLVCKQICPKSKWQPKLLAHVMKSISTDLSKKALTPAKQRISKTAWPSHHVHRGPNLSQLGGSSTCWSVWSREGDETHGRDFGERLSAEWTMPGESIWNKLKYISPQRFNLQHLQHMLFFRSFYASHVTMCPVSDFWQNARKT